jgi:hypothetical protein
LTAGIGGNVTINNLVQSTGSGLNINAANGTWGTGQGQVLFGANGKLDFATGLYIYTGLSTTGNFARSSFDDSINILNASVVQNSANDFYLYGFDTVKLSKSLTAGTIDIRAKNILLNNAALTSYSWMQLWASSFNDSNGTQNDSGWQQQSGQLTITGSTMLKYGAGSTFDLRSGITDLTTGKRSTLDDANITWASSGVGGAVMLYGFDKITITKDIASSVFDWQAKDIVVGANITSYGSVFLRSAAFNQAATAAIKGAYLGGDEGYKNSLGQIIFAPTALISYAVNLDLRSGLAYDANNLSTGARSNLVSSNINWTNNNPNNYVYLGGFDTVTLDSPTTASNFQVFAQNINVNANIKASGGMQLDAASFDPGTTIKGSYTATGWYNLDGQVKVSPSVTSLSATSFDFRSGVDATNRIGTSPYNTGARVDLADVLKPYQATGAASPSGVTGIYLVGFQDVILPTSITEITGAGSYQVISRNIDGSGLAGKTLNAYGLKLWSAGFTNIGGVNKSNSATKGGMGLGSDTNNLGTITLPSTLAIQSSQFDFVSGLSTTDGKTRTDFAPASISP